MLNYLKEYNALKYKLINPVEGGAEKQELLIKINSVYNDIQTTYDRIWRVFDDFSIQKYDGLMSKIEKKEKELLELRNAYHKWLVFNNFSIELNGINLYLDFTVGKN